ncbi:MAG TPA: MgtC/SapB family protein [Candidatus Didemnitutus sp.]|nr:MgtC/SapB family protein [Candidatus Didemnitutus sp.]
MSTAVLDVTDFSHPVAQWPFLPVLSRMGMAIAVGIFVGLEREHSQKTGVRTFALASLACCLGGMMGTLYAVFGLGFAAIGIVAMNYREMAKTRELALTTSSGLAVVALAGVLFGQGHVFTPTVAGILTAALLAWKKTISHFADVVSERELRSAILLAILTFIVFPILPSHPVDPWGLIEPRSNWASVVIIAGIGFVNYVLMRLFGPRGLEITAFFGGLVNSRKVIVELGTRFKEMGLGVLRSVQRGILLATGAMLIRNGLIVAVLAPQAALRCVIPLSLMLLASAGLWRRIPATAGEASNPELRLESPFRLAAALKFGFVFLLLNVTGALAQRQFGQESFYFVSIAGGLLSSASSIAAAATLMARHEISDAIGINGIVLSTLTSVLANIPLIQSLLPDKALKRRINLELAGIALVGLLGVFANELVFRHLFPA